MQLWDTAGQEKYKSLFPSFVRGSSAIVLVYDVTKTASFDHVRTWASDARKDVADDAMFVLVGCKIDRSEERQVSADEGSQLALELGCASFAEVSAKTGANIITMFNDLANALQDEAPSSLKAGTEELSASIIGTSHDSARYSPLFVTVSKTDDGFEATSISGESLAQSLFSDGSTVGSLRDEIQSQSVSSNVVILMNSDGKVIDDRFDSVVLRRSVDLGDLNSLQQVRTSRCSRPCVCALQ